MMAQAIRSLNLQDGANFLCVASADNTILRTERRSFRQNIARMADSISHRGPDDEGYYIAGPVGLGFRRLSIIDIDGGHQPMSDQEGSVWVIFNGEIYNFPELKRELVGFGHVFRTNSDTEVIVHGYKQWGDDVFNHLNGMFGLAIWDVQQERLILARDPFGIKLIYYKIDKGRLYFGSEIRAIRAATNEKARSRSQFGESVSPVSLYSFTSYHVQGRSQAGPRHHDGVRKEGFPSASMVPIPADAFCADEVHGGSTERNCSRCISSP